MIHAIGYCVCFGAGGLVGVAVSQKHSFEALALIVLAMIALTAWFGLGFENI